MDSLDPARLQALLDLLVESGVEEFEGGGIHVRFTPNLFTPDKEVPQADGRTESRQQEMRNAKNLWEVPELWPGGKPPQFPGTIK